MAENIDLLGYLYDAYMQKVRGDIGKAVQDNPGETRVAIPPITVVDFVTFARETLTKNQPISTTMMGASVALTLQDGTQVLLVDNEEGEQTPMQRSAPAIPLTPIKPGLGHRGGGMSPSKASPITGLDK